MAKNKLTLKDVVVFVSDADGKTSHEEVSVTLDSDGMFNARLPDYYTACPDIPSTLLHFDTLSTLVSKFENLSDVYSRWRLGIQAVPHVMLAPSKDDGADAGYACVALGYERVFVVPGQDLHVYENDGGKIGKKLIRAGHVVLPDTPEVLAQCEALVNSIRQAGDVLDTLVKSTAQETFFLAIGKNFAPKSEPVQKVLPLEEAEGPGKPGTGGTSYDPELDD